jgi:hypothetical protein
MADAFDIMEYTKEAKGIAFDTCHKIYILMDDEQMNLMKRYGYDPLISSDEMDAEEMANTVLKWYEESCGLRFINAVHTNPENPNDGFINVVSQFENNENYWDEDGEDDDDEEEEE